MIVKERLELARGIVRPLLIAFLGLTSFILVLANMIYEIELTTYAKLWIGLFIFGGGEWILERPIGKMLSNVNISKSAQS